ncbi:ATP-binding protein [Marivirga tractuosa]|uniref:ATP-binding protein n=1 Tax=Marivirga tractuosa TaxID=1006 RepID=UPI0035CEB636
MLKRKANNALFLVLLSLSISILVLSPIKGQVNAIDSAKHYIKIAKDNWHNDLQKSHDAAKIAYQLIPKLDNKETIADAFAQYGVSFYTRLEYDSAITYYKKAVSTIKDTEVNNYRFISYLCSALEKKGQYKEVFDIIKKELETTEGNVVEQYGLLLIKLSSAIEIGFTEDAISITDQIEEIIPKLNTETNLDEFLKLKGKYYQLIASFQKSDSIFNQLIIYYDSTNNKMDKAESLLFLAQNAMEVSRYKESSRYLIQSQSIYDSLNYEYGIANINLHTGTLLSWMQRYNEASNYIFKALKVFEKNNNLNEIQKSYYELGWIFYSLEMENRAKKYLNQSLEIAREIQNYQYLGNDHNALGSLYTDLEEYDSAIFYFDSSIYYQKITKSIKGISAAKFNKAVVLEKLGKDEKALELYKESYKVDLKLKNYTGLIEGEWVLGEYFMKKNQLDSALYYFNLGEKHAIELGEKYFLLKIYQAQAKLNDKVKNFELQASYLEKALKTQKELSEENKTLELATLETTYDLKNKEKELALLNLQKENNEQTIALNQKTIQSQRNTLILLAAGIFLLLIISYIIFRYLKVRTRTNHQLRELNNEIQEKQEEIMAQSEELKEANDQVHELNQFLEKRVKERTLALEDALSELDHFFYRASHDFRGPLTTLMGLVGISKSYQLSEEASDLFNQVNLTVKKLDTMVKKLQAVSFLGDFQNLKSPQEINLKNEIDLIANEVIKNKSDKAINYNYELNINTAVEAVFFYPVILNICLSNLIENSFIFNYSSKIKILINAKVEENQLILSVKDNGVGISEDVQKEIYSMFKRTSQTSTGNGLGLYIVKKAIDILNGQIQLESETGNGSTFTLKFPLSNINHDSNRSNDKVLLSQKELG